MAQVTGAFPYDVDNLLGGAVRILYAPIGTALTTSADISTIINMESPYAPKTGWIDIGATKEGFTYTRSFDTEGFEIQQVPGAILEDITDLSRTVEVSVAEFRPTLMRIMEEGAAVEAVTAAAGKSAQQRVKFGSFTSVTQFRMAWIARRHVSSGLVTESAAATPPSGTRGRFVAGVAYRVQITADEIEYDGSKGELSAVGVSFKLFPETGGAAGSEYGMWLDETAGTIA